MFDPVRVSVTTMKAGDFVITLERDEDKKPASVYVRQSHISTQGIRQLLAKISPDCSRDDWLRVGSYLMT